MQENRSKNENHLKWSLRSPVVVAIAVALFGVLARIHDLNLTLISVQRLPRRVSEEAQAVPDSGGGPHELPEQP